MKMIREQVQELRSDRKISEKAQRMAADRLIRDLRDKQWEEIKRMKDRIISREDFDYQKQRQKSEQIFMELAANTFV